MRHYQCSQLSIGRICCMVCASLLMAGCWGDIPLNLDVRKSNIIEEIDQSVPSLMSDNGVDSVSIAVIRNGAIEFTKSFGEISENSVLEFASLGKPVFAYAVLTLAKQGLIDLDAPIVKYVPDIFSGNDPRLQTITARMLLSHTSGLPNLGQSGAEVLKFNPGAEFQYSGVGYVKLQKVIERVTSKPLDELASDNVFNAAEMHSSSYVWMETFESSVVSGRKADRSVLPVRRTQESNAASSLYSTVADYAAFVAFILNESASTDTIAIKMVNPAIKITDEISWGMGWGLQNTMPNKSFWHWGSNPGYRHYVVGYPKEQIAVVVVSNSENMFKIVDEIIGIAIGGSLPSYDWF